MPDLNYLKNAVVLIGLVVLLGAAAAIGLDDYQTDLDGVCEDTTGFSYNTTRAGSDAPCCNSTAGASQDCSSSDSYAYNITNRGLEAGDNATDFMDTIGTILGISVLIGIVILAFTFGKR